MSVLVSPGTMVRLVGAPGQLVNSMMYEYWGSALTKVSLQFSQGSDLSQDEANDRRMMANRMFFIY